MSSTAEREAECPEIAGFFPAILQGDETRAREILQYLKDEGSCMDDNVADQLLDATGDAPLVGAIQYGHIGIVRLLLEYGADPNRRCTMPVMRGSGMTYFNLALLLFDNIENAEEIVYALIDGGGDVHAMSDKGTPLTSAVKIQSDHAARMRVCRKLLDVEPIQIKSSRFRSMASRIRELHCLRHVIKNSANILNRTTWRSFNCLLILEPTLE